MSSYLDKTGLTELWAKIKAYITTKLASYLPLSGGTLTGDLLFSNSITTTRQIRGVVGYNDYWRVSGGATASNDGWMEIATADDGTEPIYVRQYYGVYNSIAHSVTLLDASGNTLFPGIVTASAFSGNATSATKAVQDGKGNVIADTYSTKESTSTSVGLASNGSGSYNINFYNASGTRLFTLSNSDIITLLTTGSMPSNIKAYADVSGVALSNRCSRIALTSNGYSFYNESGSVMFNVTNSMLFSLAQSYINSNAGADFLVHSQSSLHLRSSEWDWEGSGPTGTGSRVLHIATISGLGLIHIKGIHSAGTSGYMGIIDVEIGPRTGSLNHAEKAISDSSLAYVRGSSIDKMDLYVKEAYGANHYQMSVVEMIAGAAIIWDTTSSAVTAPTNLVSIT